MPSSENKSTKKEANYHEPVLYEPCRTCSMFVKPNECTAVEGRISPAGHCDYYERKE